MPELPALVTAADMAAFGYDPVPDPILARASARVRRYTRQQITLGMSTVTLWAFGPWLLPQRPVVEVLSVRDADGADVIFELKGQHLHSDVCAPLTADYDHGFDPLPDDLTEIVCQIATRLNAIPAAVAAGARTEQAGGETVTWGAEGFAATSGLTPAERAALDDIFPRYPRTVRLI